MGYGVFLPCCGAKTGKRYVIKPKNKLGSTAFANIRGKIFRPCCGSKNGGKYVISPTERPGHSLDGDQNVNIPPNISVLTEGAQYEIHEVQGSFGDPEHEYGQPIEISEEAYGEDCSTSKDNEKETMESHDGYLASCLENVKSLEEKNVELEKNICDGSDENDGLVISVCNQHFHVITEMISELLSTTSSNDSLDQEIEDNQMNVDGSRKSNEMALMVGTKAEEELRQHSGSLENIESGNQALDLHKQHPEENSLQEKKTREKEVTSLQAPIGTGVNVGTKTCPFINLHAALPEIRVESLTLTERDLDDVEKILQEMEVSSLQAPKGSNVNVNTKNAPFIDLKAALPEIRDESVTKTKRDLNDVKKMLQETEVTTLQASLGTKVNVDTKNAPSKDLKAVLPEIRDEPVTQTKRDLNDDKKMLQEKEVTSLHAPIGTKVNADTKNAPFVDLKAVLPVIRDESLTQTKRDLNDVKKILQERDVTSLQAPIGTKVNVDTKTAPSKDLKAVLPEIRDEPVTRPKRDLNDDKKMLQETEVTSLQSPVGTRVKVNTMTAPSIDLKAALPEIRDESITRTKRDLDDVKKILQETVATGLQVQPGAGGNVEVETVPSKDLNAAMPVILNDSAKLMEKKHEDEPFADGKTVGSNSEVYKGQKSSIEEYDTSKNNNLVKFKKKKTAQLLNRYLESLDADQNFNNPQKTNVLKKRSIKRASRNPKHESSADGQSMRSNYEANKTHGSSFEDSSTSKNNCLLNINQRETDQLASCLENVKSSEEENMLRKETCDSHEENKSLAIAACSQYVNVISDLKSQILPITSQKAKISYEIEDDQMKADGYEKSNEMKPMMGAKAERVLRHRSGSLENIEIKSQALDLQKYYPKKDSLQVKKTREGIPSTNSQNARISYEIGDDQKNDDGYRKGNEMKPVMGTKAEKELRQHSESLESMKIKNQALDLQKYYPKKEDDQKNADGYRRSNEMKPTMRTKAEKELHQHSGSLENSKIKNQALDLQKYYPKKEDDQKNADGYRRSNEMKPMMETKAEKELRQHSGSLDNSKIKNQALDLQNYYPKKEDDQMNADSYRRSNEMKPTMGTKAEKELLQHSGSLENIKIKNQDLDLQKYYPKKEDDQKNADGYRRSNETKPMMRTKTEKELLQHSGSLENINIKNQALSVHKEYLKKEDDQKNADGNRRSNEMKPMMGTKAEKELLLHSGSLENMKIKNQALSVYKEYPKKDSLQVMKTREEDVTRLQAQLPTRNNVEADTAQSGDFNATLSEVRNKPEKLKKKKRESSAMGQPIGSHYETYRRHRRSIGDYHSSKKYDALTFNEKETMQSLNGRLASYLENVKSLEEENAMLEKKIYKWYKENESLVPPDSSQHFNVITDLMSQILSISSNNASLSQEIDDNQMNADGYRKSYETELTMRSQAEQKLRHHHGLLESIKMENQSLDLHIKYLKEESLQVRKTREEEVSGLQAPQGVNVKVETAPFKDLNAALSEIRNESQTLMERNINDIENMFQEMTNELSREASSGIEHLLKNIENIQLADNELMKLKHSVYTLETELKKQKDMKTVHECTLAEIRGHYSSNLSDLQDMISVKESHLANIQYKLRHLNYDKAHLDLKASLEKEIDAYKDMLGEYHNLPPTNHPEKERNGIHFGK